MHRIPSWARTRDPLFILSFPAAAALGKTVRSMVTDPQVQAEAILEIRRRFSRQAAFTGLMDLSLEAEAFGCPVRFADDDLPTVLEPVIHTPQDAEALVVPDLEAGRIPVTLEALKRVHAQDPDTPLLAGCIGPFSLAGRLADPSAALMMPVTDPDTLKILLDKATACLIQLIEAFKAAGCAGVIMAEPMAGLMSPAMNRRFVVPWLKRIIDAVQTEEFSVMLHNCGPSAGKCWNVLRQSGAAVYHFGNAVDLLPILESSPDTPVYGNLDPTAFVSETPETIACLTQYLIDSYGQCPMWRLSSGCDIPAAAHPAALQAAFDAWDKWLQQN